MNMYKFVYFFLIGLWMLVSAQGLNAQCTGFSATATFTPVSCFGGSNGSVNAGVQNGTPPFTYVWNSMPVQTTATATGLGSGTYQVTVTDNAGCISSASTTVTEPSAMSHASGFTPVSCFGGTNGTATILIIGGTAPYTYSWNTLPAQTTTVATGLSAGSWTVQVLDNNTCGYAAQVVVSEPPPLSFSTTYIPVSCTGNADGSAIVQVTGGTPVYSYNWSTTPTQTTQTATGLLAGTYKVLVTDGNGCIDSSNSVNVLTSAPLLLQTHGQKVSCNGFSDGVAWVAVNGGNPGYSYSWNSVPVQTSSTASGLGAGVYTVTVVDSRGCQDQSSVLIIEPLPLQVSTTAIDVSCYGQTNGASSGTGFGGTQPYLFSWSTTPIQNVQTITGLGAGIYNLTITDSAGCIVNGQAIVRQPQPLIVQTTYNMPSCFGGNDGQLIANVSGGVPIYTYLWSGGQTSASIGGQVAGSYQVRVRDGNGCEVNTGQSLAQPMPLQIQTGGTDLNCMMPMDNGTAWASGTGGTAPYSYVWTGGLTPNQAYNTGLSAGTWSVQVSDAKGCTQQSSVVLLPANRPVAIAGPDTFFCEGSGGVGIQGGATGGVGPYSYTWFPNNGSLSNAFAASTWANPDSSVTYSLTVVDAAGCASLLPATVRVTLVPLPVVDAGTDEGYCQDGPAVFLSGQILNQIPGGYSIQWQPSSGLFCPTCLTTYATPSVTTIYTLRVKHLQSGCTSDSTTLSGLSSAIITVKPRPIADAGPDTSICQGNAAMLCATATGVGPLYFWNWSPNIQMNDSTLQCPTVSPPHTVKYFVVATSDGCESEADSVMVNVIPVPVADAGNVKNICPGDSIRLDGICQQVGQQIYSWTPVNGLSSTNILQPMASPANTQWYYLQASVAGCPGPIDSVEVIVHPRPIADAGPDTIICDTVSGYMLQGNYTGGAQPVRVNWTPGGTLSSFNILNPLAFPKASTYYYLTVTSGTPPTQCSSRDSVLVTVLPALKLTVSQDTGTICYGDSVHLTAVGGNGNPTFQWLPVTGLDDPNSANPVASPLVSTTYSVTLSEGQCRMRDTVRIVVHPMLQAGFVMSQPEGCGEYRVRFQNLSSGAVHSVWDFRDGSPLSNLKEEDHIYTQPGTYIPQLVIMGIGGCSDTVESPLPVIIRPEFVGKAIVNPAIPTELTLPQADIHVNDVSEGSVRRMWDFGDGNISPAQSLSHRYTQPGTYKLRLETWDSAGCSFIWEGNPVVVKSPELFVPNVFSPNNDGINDLFRVDYSGHELFLLQIYDRWGVKQYETRNQMSYWDGRDLNGRDVPEGVYFWQVGMGESRHTGEVTVVR